MTNMYLINRFSLVLVVFLSINFSGFLLGNGAPTLYKENKDDVEILNKTNFKSIIYNSDRASFVEFYAHWCGACQRYAQHWKEIAKETKLWHSKVIRIAAINCGDSSNDEICREFHIEYYPTLRLFPPKANYDKTDHDSKLIQTGSNDVLIQQMVDFVEAHPNKPPQWPDLEAYTSKRLDTMFIPNRECKFGFLLFEKDDSNVGKRLILDFSAYTDKVVIRRVTITSNPSLINKFEIDTRKLPLLFLVNNTDGSMKPYEKFDENLLKKYAKSNQKGLNVEENDDDDDEDEEDFKDNIKNKFAYWIRKFIKHNNVMSRDDFNKLKDHVNAGKAHAEEVKKEEIKQFLSNVSEKLHMQDLESSLNVMLRSEIPRIRLISGAKFTALKEWIKVLNKYFPGRKPVKNYLKMLNDRLNSSQVTEITGNQWKIFADEENKPMVYLPDKTEWIHCKGSDSKYRGFPCSLWSLFHVLTVSQIDFERLKPRPFEDDFNVKEVIEAIKLFVENFFGCKECANNFAKETEDYLKYLSKPYDAVKYLWKVHNSVNKRLAKDETEDPKYPKIQFPSKEQCPKCYLSSVKNLDNLAEHESPWEYNEVLLFLTSYYSKLQIEPIKDENELGKQVPPEPGLDEPNLDGEKEPDKNNFDVENKSRFERQYLEEQERLKLDDEDSIHQSIRVEQKKTDLKLSLGFILLAFSAFGFMFIYFNYTKRKTKLKKHII